ncbi:MAG: YajQ family cyclic di-GMP-binding protein [Candidatus Margulisiibacteriota bacterium]
MAQACSFDIVSKVNYQEADNAIAQTIMEIRNRFDFKGSISNIERSDNLLNLVSDDDYKLKSVIDILQTKLIKRGISLKFLDYGKVESSLGGNVKQVVTLKDGIDQARGKEINKLIKESKLKVQSQIQGDQLRVSGKSKDDLQQVMQFLKEKDLDIELQFVNYR